tara:strand:+ start:1593 stop:1892 length:300 start_codon:yes stop_codon:yes gene_type:complete
MEKCFKVLNEEGKTMTPCGNWWYDEWSDKFNYDEIKRLLYYENYQDTFYTDTVNNAFSALKSQEKGYYYIVECESDGRGDVEPTNKTTKYYYNGENKNE